MVLDNTQRTRNDVDVLDITTVSTQIDNHPSLSSPYMKEIEFDNVSSLNNVWFENGDGDLETNNFVGHDVVNIMFDYDEMVMKVIDSLDLRFTIATEYGISIEKVGIVGLTETYTDIQIAVNDVSDIDISIDISDVGYDDIVSLINQSRFGIFVELSGGLINSHINISDMFLVSGFSNVLQDEIDAVRNRYETFTDGLNFDDYVKYDDLNNLPPLDDEGDVGEIHSYIDEAIGNLELDLDFEFGLSGVDDSIRIRSRIIKGSD